LKIAPNGTEDHLKAQKDLDDEIAHRKRDDRNVMLMWKHLFGKETSSDIMLASIHHRAADETNCLKMLVRKLIAFSFIYIIQLLHNDLYESLLKSAFYADKNLQAFLWYLFNIWIEVCKSFCSHVQCWLL
jgi:hypothetical protein